MKSIILLTALFTTFLSAKEHEVQMLSFSNENGPMVFEPAVLRIEAGDTVTFIPSQSGHQVDSVIVPKGAKKFKSELNQKFSITLDKEGIYFYTCLPHRAMNMSGLIQIGDPINREAVGKAIDDLESKAILNQGRMRDYLKTLDEMNAETPEPTTETPK